MPAIRVILDIEETNRALELEEKFIIQTNRDLTIHPLERGMQSGKTSVSIFIPMPPDQIEKLKQNVDNKDVLIFAETSLQTWMMATGILRSKFQDEIDEPGYAIVPQTVKDHLIPIFAEMIRRVCRVKIGKITKEMSEELAAAFIDGLSAGAPPSAFEDHPFTG